MSQEYLLIKYEDIDNCMNYYPYFENNTEKEILCKKKIKKRLNKLFFNLLKKGFSVYEFPLYKKVQLETLLADKFLFYSIQNTIEEQYYIFKKDEKKYLTLEDFYKKSQNDILVSNDFDGLGIWIITNDKKLLDQIE